MTDGGIIASALIGAAASTGGNIIQNRGSKGSQKRAYNYQRQLNEQSNEMARQNYFDMFDYEAAYNTPQRQMQRLMEAGINPYVAASEVGQGVSETSVGAPSAPSGSAPSMYQPSNIFESIPSSVAQMAQAFKTLSETKGQDIENEYNRQTLADRIRALGLQIENQDITNSIAKIQMVCDSLYKVPQAKSLLDRTQQEIVNLVSQKENFDADTALKGVEKEYYDALSKLTGKQKDLLEEQYPYLIQQLQESIKLVQEQQKTEKSKQNLNAASARNELSSAALNYSKTEYQNILNKYTPKLLKMDYANKKFEGIGKGLHNRHEALNIIQDAKKFLPELKILYSQDSQIRKQIEYTQGLIDKLPHEMDKLDSETLKNCTSAVRDVYDMMTGLLPLIGE